MKNRTLALSVLVNVALGAALFGVLIKRPASGDPPPAQTVAEFEEATPATSVPTTPAIGNPAPPHFHWSQVESADYLAYIANLRRIGCPEQTIRDIIVADVNSLYAPRYAALAATAPELAWWGRLDKRKPLRAHLAGQLRALNDEKKALLRRLLGVDAARDVAFADADPVTIREQNALAFLPAGKQAALRDILVRHRALREWSERQWKGLPSDERDARLKELHDARSRDLAALLTPSELREFALRDSPASDTLREEFGRSDMSEAEFRKLFDLYDAFREAHPNPNVGDIKRIEADYATALGPERLADLQKQNDRTWQGLQAIATERGLSPDAMNQAYSIKEQYSAKLVAAVGRMFASPEQDPRPLHELANEMESRLAAVLGQEATKQLDRIGARPRLVVQDDGKRRSYSLSRDGFSE
jgi:hypothetical protein